MTKIDIPQKVHVGLMVNRPPAHGNPDSPGLAEKAQSEPFISIALDVHTNISEGGLVRLRNTAWNAMKHARNKAGVERGDEELLAGRWQDDNEALLMEGWFNLGQAGVPLRVEAQVFQIWMLAQHAEQNQVDQSVHELFPDMTSMSGAERRDALRQAIRLARDYPDVIDSGQTDPRPLVLPA